MMAENLHAQLQKVLSRANREIEAIEGGKRYRSAAEIDAFIDEIWKGIKNFRSDVVFEFTDQFRTECNAGQRVGLDDAACKLLAFIHQQLARKMVDSEAHRDYLFQRYASSLPG